MSSRDRTKENAQLVFPRGVGGMVTMVTVVLPLKLSLGVIKKY